MSEKQKILVVEDEHDIRELLKFNLEKEGYEVQGSADGEDGFRLMESWRPQLVLLDLMLPGMSGLDFCRQARKSPSLSSTSIIMVTAKGEEEDIVTGLDLGADDYVPKPFSLRVLLARVRLCLSRGKRHPHENLSETRQGIVAHCGIRIDPKTRKVSCGESPVELTSNEFDCLLHLAEHPGWVYTRLQIVQAVHGDDYPVTHRSVDVLIVGLRRKLGDYGRFVETVRGVGYRFSELP